MSQYSGNRIPVLTTTSQGRADLGEVVRRARLLKGWSLQNVVEELRIQTGLQLTASAVSDMENGKREPQWNTVAKLSALGFICNPCTGSPLGVYELFLIACEAIDLPLEEPQPVQMSLEPPSSPAVNLRNAYTFAAFETQASA